MCNTSPQDKQAYHANPEIGELLELAAEGLVRMFDPETQLFCFRFNRTEQGLVREGSSRRYTIMSLLGLHQLEAARIRPRIDVRAVFDNLLRTADQKDDLGDLGLLLWLCAVASPQDLERVYTKIDLHNALNQYAAAREGRTMELAWFLSGLAHATLASSRATPGLADVALETYRLVKRNQGDQGIFGHLARNKSLAGLLRGRIGSFADQVYPIYAFTKCASAYHMPEALQAATHCAEAICRAQGRFGQWWWHYDSVTGRVVEQYPVYSVHQHGMAPMALFALVDAGREEFAPMILKGLRWIAGNNELSYDFRNQAEKVVWRSTFHKGYGHKFRTALRLVNRREGFAPPTNMGFKFECRPYELGWLLYALAGREL